MMMARKKISFVIFLLALAATASAQALLRSTVPKSAQDPSSSYFTQIRRDVNASYNRQYARWKGARYEIKWKDVLPLNDTTYLLYSEDRLNAYFGRVDNPERHFRNGFGVLRHTGTYDVEYYVGTWKRDMKHGQGISRIEGDSVFVATWKFGILQKDSVRKPTEAELEELATWEGRACQWLSLVR